MMLVLSIWYGFFFLRFYLIILPLTVFVIFFYKHILLIETSFSWVPFVKILNKNLFAVYFDIREISFGHINDMHKKKWKVVKKEAIECRCHFTWKAQTKNNNNNTFSLLVMSLISQVLFAPVFDLYRGPEIRHISIPHLGIEFPSTSFLILFFFIKMEKTW